MSVSPRPLFSVPLPGGRVLELGQRTLVMGILNVTPDSFADDGLRMDPDRAVADALRMIEDGVDILDIGGESTRPGAPAVPADEEWRRVAPVLERLRGVGIPVSIDTYKAEVAEKAIAAGATVVNDVSGLTFDPALAAVVGRSGAAVVLMHHRGRSDAMYARAQYVDVVADVIHELAARGVVAREAGIEADRIIFDPGIGFAKRAAQSMAVLAQLDAFATLGRPILSGPSRKSFMKSALGDVPPNERVWGTAAAVTASILAGAHIVRVHDVREMVQVVRVADAIRSSMPAQAPRPETGPKSPV
ncbi:MAG: dihydropteroate synthase [Acidobacteriota bacterium]